MTRSALRAAAGVAAAVALAVSGCTAGGPPPVESSGTTAPAAVPVVTDGVGLEILQSRTDYAVRGMQLSVSNPGSEPFTVTAARLESPQFAAPAVWQPKALTEVPPGLTRHLPVALAEPVCPTPALARDEARLTVTVTDASGATREVSASPADPFGVLSRIAGEDCFDETVAAIAELRVGGVDVRGEGSDAVARITIDVTPRESEGAFVVDAVRFTILLAPADPGDDQNWIVDRRVDGGGPTDRIVLEAVPARCDPHAIAEDKLGTVLPVEITVDGGAAGIVSLAADDAQKLQLYDFIAQHCGFAAS